MDEDKMYCKEIADKLELIVRGEMYKCFNCGNIVRSDGICPHCGELITDEDGEEYPYTLTEWIESQLDIDYIIGGDMIYKACHIYVTLICPTVWVDTWNSEVRMLGVGGVYWHISREAVDLIDQLATGYYEDAMGGEKL